jgi:diketogulonate reductase-like aldo/keto reductase
VLTSLVQAWGPLARAMRFNHSVVQSVAKKHGKDEAQIMLRWGLQHVRDARRVSPLVRFPHQTTRLPWRLDIA